MRVGTRLACGFLVLIVGFAGLLLFYQRVVDRSVETARELDGSDSELLLTAGSQLELMAQLGEDASKFRITGDRGYFDLYRSGRLALADTLARIQALPLTGQPREAVEGLAASWAEFESRFVGDADERLEAARLLSMAADEWIGFGETISRLRVQTRAMRLLARKSLSEKLGELSAGAARASTTGWLALGGAIVLGIILAFVLVRSITRPLARIERGTAALARGDFAARVKVEGRTEFAALAKRFNHMADRLAELDRAKRNFLARVSHDLKTPLASIQETQRVLLEGAPGELNAKQRRLTELGLANTERLSTMISRILELSRLEAGVEEYAFEPVELAGLARHVIERFAPDGKPVVELRAPTDGVPVLGDRGALERVLENLLDNARAHAGEGTIEVDIAAGRSGGGSRVDVQVRDHGPGIPDEQRELIFRSFSQNGDVRLASGHVGLGLAICREIVAAHGGEIWMKNAEGGGSAFAFGLPVARPTRDSGEGGREPSTEQRGGATDLRSRSAARAAVASSNVLALLMGAWGCASADPPEPPVSLPAVEVVPVQTRVDEREPIAPHPFELAYARGDWAAAVAAFEADSTLLEDEQVLFRIGLLQATPERPTFDPAQASLRLELLLERFPESEHAESARVLIGLMARLDQSAQTLAALEEQLEQLKAVDLRDPPPPF